MALVRPGIGKKCCSTSDRNSKWVERQHFFRSSPAAKLQQYLPENPIADSNAWMDSVYLDEFASSLQSGRRFAKLRKVAVPFDHQSRIQQASTPSNDNY